MASETTLIGLQRQKPWLFGPRMSRLKSLCCSSAPAPCSAHLQVSMCVNLQCPPEGGLYKSAQKPRCHADSETATHKDPLLDNFQLVGGAAGYRLARWRGHYRGHFSDHGKNQAFVALGKRGAVFLDFGKETYFVFGKLTQHFLSVAVARRFRAGKEIGKSDLHGLRNFGECL